MRPLVTVRAVFKCGFRIFGTLGNTLTRRNDACHRGELYHEAVFEWEPTLDDAINMLSGRFQYEHVDVDFWVTWALFGLARVFFPSHC